MHSMSVYIELDYSNPKDKVAALFRTLAESRRLASFVQSLELTDFPKGISPALLSIENTLIPALRNCVNLSSCRWTRDGTLSNDVLETLQSPDRVPLRVLEINANSRGFYDASKLLGFTSLTKLALILPDAETTIRLPVWCEHLGGTLKELTIIRKMGPLITDEILQRMAEHLINLTHFSIINCSSVTHESVLCILRASLAGIQSLYLGPLSTQFSWDVFTAQVRREQLFKKLSRLTLSAPTRPDGWCHLALSSLVNSTPLAELDLYNDGMSTTSSTSKQMTAVKEQLRTLTKTHGSSIEAMSLLRMDVTSESLAEICSGFPKLKKLFFSYLIAQDPWPVTSLAPLTALKQLEFFHVNSIRQQSFSRVGLPIQEDVVLLVQQCSPSLTQCGFDTRVWKINRKFEQLPDGEWKRTITLGPYDRVEVPEQFLVVRT